MHPSPLGVYVHVPFCVHRCDYCDFATWTDRDHLIEAYVDACVTDLERQFADGRGPATTVFFGGGTPSLLAPDALARIIDAIPAVSGAEITVECNPDSVDPAKLAGYRSAGANRVSLGVQSLVPSVLAELGRTHDPDNVAKATAWARSAGFERLNVDVIFGAAGEGLDDWRRTVDGVIELEPDHISAYALTVVPSTPLGRQIAAGATPPPDDDDQATKYELADAAFTDAGFDWYEISNWARPREECRHNLLYWDQGDYLAVGCAAHGHRDGERWWNVRTPERYVEAVAAAQSPRAGTEHLEARTRAEEAFGLALRTRAGVVVASAARETAIDLAAGGILEPIYEPDEPDELGEAGAAGMRVVLTRVGRLLGDDVTARLLLAGAVAPADALPTPTRLALGRLEC
ncbi:MAG: radical SAM family heme chaperone HemW [Acidimicrobiia bacterium]